MEKRSLGIRIEHEIEKIGISQMELAKRISLDKSVLNRIISGERRARDNELIALSKELQVTIDDLLGISVSALPAKKTEVNQMKTVAKVLRFSASIWSANGLANHIELTINKTIAEMEKRNYYLQSTSVSTIEINPHNNGGGAYVADIIYTLLFRLN